MSKFNQLINSIIAEEVSYDPMLKLASKAQEINNILAECGDDALRPEHCKKAAEIIVGGSSEWMPEDYKRMVEGLAFVLEKMCIVNMN